MYKTIASIASVSALLLGYSAAAAAATDTPDTVCQTTHRFIVGSTEPAANLGTLAAGTWRLDVTTTDSYPDRSTSNPEQQTNERVRVLGHETVDLDDGVTTATQTKSFWVTLPDPTDVIVEHLGTTQWADSVTATVCWTWEPPATTTTAPAPEPEPSTTLVHPPTTVFVAPPTTAAPAPTVPAPSTTVPPPVLYPTCDAAADAGALPLYAGQPGYGTHLDRNGDGEACDGRTPAPVPVSPAPTTDLPAALAAQPVAAEPTFTG